MTLGDDDVVALAVVVLHQRNSEPDRGGLLGRLDALDAAPPLAVDDLLFAQDFGLLMLGLFRLVSWLFPIEC